MCYVKTGTRSVHLSSFHKITRGEEGQVANVVENMDEAFDWAREIKIMLF